MLARFRVLLPFLLHLREGDDAPPQRIQEGEYDISIQPLTRSQVNREGLNLNAEMSLSAIVNAMEPAVPPPRSGTVRIDGAPAIPVDLVEIRFAKDDFDRRPASQDPPLQLCYELANGLLQRIRAVARSFFIEPLDSRTTWWRIDYLNNDETPLPPDNLLVRARKGASFVSGGTIDSQP
jgi:hypothetical protein